MSTVQQGKEEEWRRDENSAMSGLDSDNLTHIDYLFISQEVNRISYEACCYVLCMRV